MKLKTNECTELTDKYKTRLQTLENEIKVLYNDNKNKSDSIISLENTNQEKENQIVKLEK